MTEQMMTLYFFSDAIRSNAKPTDIFTMQIAQRYIGCVAKL